MEIQMSNPNCDNVTKQPTKPRKKNALVHGIYAKDILLPWEPVKSLKSFWPTFETTFDRSVVCKTTLFSIWPICDGKNTGCTRCTLPRLTENRSAAGEIADGGRGAAGRRQHRAAARAALVRALTECGALEHCLKREGEVLVASRGI
jgi:hypothetical protein